MHTMIGNNNSQILTIDFGLTNARHQERGSRSVFWELNEIYDNEGHFDIGYDLKKQMIAWIASEVCDQILDKATQNQKFNIKYCKYI